VRLFAEAREEAKQQRDENLQFDSVWAVFDVDEHPNLAEACALASREGIEVGMSNPCFELWALLHFQDQRAHVERDVLASILRSHIRGYEKGAAPLRRAKFQQFRGFVKATPSVGRRLDCGEKDGGRVADERGSAIPSALGHPRHAHGRRPGEGASHVPPRRVTESGREQADRRLELAQIFPKD
jgi:hypothetical protein